MGISHPLSDEFGGGGGMLLLSPPSSPPPPASCCSGVDGQGFLEHQVSRMDTLAGIAIKYGVEIPDIKRANGLVSDSQMYAHKTLLIPLPGTPMPSSVMLNGSSQRPKRAWAPKHQLNRGVVDSLDSSNSSHQRSSLAMSSLQSYYGLSSQTSGDMDCSTELSLYSKGSSQCETLLDSSSPQGSRQSTGRSQNSEGTANGFSAANGAAKEKHDGSMRRRQKVESDAPDDLLSDSIKMIKSFLPRPISSIRLSTDTNSPDPSAKSNGSFLDGFKSAVRKSPSAPSFVDTENSGVSMWSSSKWTLKHDSFTRPLLDAVPKPAPVRKTKAALD